MNDRTWQLVEHVFNVAIELPASQRPAYLASACLNDTVRAEVESLIAAEEQSKTYFESRIAGAARELAAERESKPPKKDEDRLGPYRLIRPLGSGGLGEVYLAERAEGDDRTRVAIRILRGSVQRDCIARMVAERRTLARLHHPNIARLLDGGETPGGAPYVVMELVEGEPLDAYCDSRGLEIGERIQLFRKVCAGVCFSHRNLVAHCDLKPDNILVMGDGVPKLLDFGVATLQSALQETAEPAQAGSAKRPMTPRFASPEQIRGEPANTASDVYALGVVLYALLCGRPPYEVRSSSALEIERIVCELEPRLPSAAVRVGTSGPGPGDKPETAESVSRKRGCTPAKLERRLRGDFDNIVLKAMSKEPGKRYASAEQLAEDLDRALRGLAVRASGDSRTYRAGKFVGRHRTAVVAAAVFAALLLGLAVSKIVSGRRMAAEEIAAETTGKEAEAVVAYLTDIFGAADPRERLGSSVTARQILDWGVERVSRETLGRPDRQARLLTVLSDGYRNLGLYSRAQELAGEALTKRIVALGERHPDVAATLNCLGRIEYLQGRYDQAEKLYRRALEIDRDAKPENQAAVASDLDGLAMVLLDAGDYEQAESLAREALELRRKASGAGSSETADSMHHLGIVLGREGRYGEAEGLLRAALEIDRWVKGDLHPDIAVALHDIGDLLRQAGRLEEAEEALGKALSATIEIYGERHLATADNLRSLAGVLHERGRPKEARDMLQVALDIDRSALGPERLEVAADLTAIGRLDQDAGDMANAELHFRRAHEIRRASLDPDHPLVASSLLALGSLLAKTERAVEGEPLLREGLRILEKTLPAEHWQIAEARTLLAVDLAAQGRYEEAERILRDGPAAEGVEPLRRRRALAALVSVYESWGRPADAARARESLQRMN